MQVVVPLYRQARGVRKVLIEASYDLGVIYASPPCCTSEKIHEEIGVHDCSCHGGKIYPHHDEKKIPNVSLLFPNLSCIIIHYRPKKVVSFCW